MDSFTPNDGGIPLLIVTVNFLISAGLVWLGWKLFPVVRKLWR